MAIDRPAPRALPAAIGRYRIVSRLGKGAMGLVYAARDEIMDRPVAIKVMMADLEDDPETASRFYREARAAGQLVHRNIITIYDMGEDDGRPFIVMELLEGQTLGEYLRRPGGVPLQQRLDLMVQLCDGLRAAHANGIFHRDVKPGNLLVTADGCLKILDFGIAHIASSSMTASGLVIGTPDYMSPEQASGHEVDHRTDIFSAGAVFYFMLTGRKPFAAQDLPAVLHKVIREDPLPIRDSEASPLLTQTVMRALAKSPAARFQTCEDMIAQLQSVQAQLAADRDLAVLGLRQSLQAIEIHIRDCEAAAIRLDLADQPEATLEWRSFKERFPWTVDLASGSLTVLVAAEDASRARSEAEALQERCAAARESLWQTEKGVRDLTRLLESGQPHAALAHAERAARLVPSSRAVQREAERCRQAIALRAAVETRVRSLHAEARAAIAARQWALAVELCNAALRDAVFVSQSEELRNEANALREADIAARQRACTDALATAEALARRRQFAEAATALSRAREAVPDAAELDAFARRLDALRSEAQLAEERQHRALDMISNARSLFEEGRRQDAIDALAAFHSTAPTVGVSAEILRLTAEAQRLEVAERRAARASDLAAAAEQALTDGDAVRALASASEALALVPDHESAVQVRALASAAIAAEAERRARADQAARKLQTARELLARRRFDKARALVRQATMLEPASEAASALGAEIAACEREAAAEAERLRVARQCASAAAPALAMARTAEAKHDLVRAAWLAENALALDKDNAEANALLVRVRDRLTAQPGLADETVDVSPSGRRAADPDDTVTIMSGASSWRRVSEAIRNWSGRQIEPRSVAAERGQPPNQDAGKRGTGRSR